MPLTYPQPADRPLVLGHRGASAYAGDNTREAFRLVVEQGADGVELDVRFTADDVIVLSHDPHLPGLGVLADHTYEELHEKLPDVLTLDEGAAVRESLLAIRRAGADLIVSYYAVEALERGWLG